MKIVKKIIIVGLVMATSMANSQSNSSLAHDGIFQANPNAPAAALDCDNGSTPSIYGQPLDAANFSNANTSDEEATFTVSESIVDGAGVITPLSGGLTDSISFWGINAEFDPMVGFVAECLDDNTANTSFNLTFHADAAGAPGAVIASVVATPSLIEDTTVPFAFATIYKYDVSFPATDLTGVAWVTYQRQTGASTPGGNQCLFLTVNESLAGTYDDSAIQNDGNANTDTLADTTYCISEAAAPPVPVPSLNLFSLVLLLLILSGFTFFVFRKENS
jgi:hypothetical protein